MNSTTTTATTQATNLATIDLSDRFWSETLLDGTTLAIEIDPAAVWDAQEGRRYVASFGPGHHYADLSEIRRTLRGMADFYALARLASERARLWSVEAAVLDAITATPGINTRDLQTSVRAKVKARDAEIRRARTALFDRGVILTTNGTNRAVFHYLGDDEAVAAARVEPDFEAVDL